MNWDSFQRVPPTPNQYDVFYDGFGARPSATTTIPTDNHQHHGIETSAPPRHRQESGTGGREEEEEEGEEEREGGRFNSTSVGSGFQSYENETFSRREEVAEGCGRWPSTSMYPKECGNGSSMSYNDASLSYFSGANERPGDNGANSSSHHLSHTDRTRFEGGQGVGGSEKDKEGEASATHSSIHSVLASSTNASFSQPHYRPNNASTQDLPQAPSKSMQQPHHRLSHLAYNSHHHHHHHYQQQQQHHPSGYTLTGGYESALQNAHWNHYNHDQSCYPNATQTLNGAVGNKPLLESDDSNLAKQAGDSHGSGFSFRDSFHSLYSGGKDMVSSDASADSGGSLTPSNLNPLGWSSSSVLGGFSWPGPRRPRQEEEKEEREEGSEEGGMLIQEGRPLPPFLPPHEPGRAGAQEGAKGEREDRDNREELAQALASGFGITKGRHEENESGMKKKEMSAPSSSLHTPSLRPTLALDQLSARNRRWKRRRGSPGMVTEKADSVTSSCSFSSEESSSSTSFSEAADENEDEEGEEEDDEYEAGDEDGWGRMDAKMAPHYHQRRLKELALELLRARKRWGKNMKKRNKKTKKAAEPSKRSSSSTFMAADNHPTPFRVGKAGNSIQEEHVDDEVDPVLTPKGRDRVLPSNSSSIPEAIRKTEECKRGRSKKRRKIERMERIASDLLLQLNWEDAERGARHEAAYCNVKSGGRESRTNNEHHDEDDVDDNKTMGNEGASERRRPTEAFLHRSLAQVEATSLLHRDEEKEGSKFPCCCNTSARGQKSTETCEHEYFGLTGNSKAIHGEQGMTTTSTTTLTATTAATLTTTTISSTTNVPSATQPTSTTRTAEGNGDNGGGRKENITPNRSSASFFSQLHVRDTVERASDHYLSEKTFESSRYWPQVKNQVSSQDFSQVNLGTSDLTPHPSVPNVNDHCPSLRERGRHTSTTTTTDKTMEFTVFHHPQSSPIISTVHAASASNSCDYVNFGPIQASLSDPAHSSSTTTTTALFQHQPQHTPLFAHHGPSGSTNQIDLQYPSQTQAPHVPIMFQPNLCVIQSGVSPGQCSTDSGYYGGAVTPQQQFYSTDIILNNANLSSVPMSSQTNSPTTSLPEEPSLDETGSQASSSLPNGELHHYADSSWTPPMDCNNDPNRESRLYASSQSCDFLPPNSTTATATGGNRFDESSCHNGTRGTGTTHCEDHVPPSPGSSVLGSSPDDDLSQLVDQVLDSIEEESSSLSSQSPSLAPGSSSSSATSCFHCGSILLTSGSCPLCSSGGFTTGNGDQGRTNQMPEEPEDNMDANQEALVINKGELLLQHQQQQHQQHTHHVTPLVHQVNPSASTIAVHSLSSTTSSSSSYLTQRKPKRSIGVVEPRVVVKLRVPNKDEQDKDLKKAGHSVGPRTTTTMTTMTAKKAAAKNKSIVSGQRPNHSSMSDGSEDVEHEYHSSGLTSGKSRKRERRPLGDDIHRKRGHNEEGEDDDDDHYDDHDATQEQKASSASSRLKLELGPNQIRKAKKPRIAPSTHLEDNHHQLVLNRLSITKTLPEHFKRALERRREGSIFEPNEKPSSSKTPNATRNCQVRLQKLDVCQYDDENESDRHLQHQTPPPPQQQQQQRPSSRSSNETSSGDEDSDDSEKSAFIQHSQSLPTFSDLAAAFQECNQKESRRKRVSKGTTGNISALTIAKRSEKEGRESECGHDGTAPMSSRVAERPASSSLQQSGPSVRRGRSKSSERDRSAIAISGSDTGKKSTETRRVWEDKENARNNPNYYATHLPSQKVDEANNIETSPDKPTKAIKIPPTFCQLSLENVVFTKRAPKVSSSQRAEASHVSLTNVADSSCSTDTNVSSPRKTWPALPGRKKRTQGSSLSTKRNERGAQGGPTEQDKQEKVHVEEKMPEQHVHVPEAQHMSSGHFPATVATPCESGTMKYVPNSTTIGKHVSLNQDYETLFSPIEPLQGHHEDLTSSAMSLNDSGKSSEASNLLDMPLLDELGQSHMSDWHDFVSNPQHQNGSPPSSPDNHQTEGTQSRNDGYLKAVSPHKILSDTRGSSAPSQIITPTPDGADKVNVFSSQALLKRRREARTVSKSDMATQAVEEDISSPTDQEATADTIINASRPTVTPTIAKETRAPKKKTRPQFTFAKEPQSQWMYCDIESCNFWTRKPERMKRHKLCHTSGHHKNFECPDCGLRFYSLPKMLKHDRKKHTGIKDYECRLCGAEVSDIGVHMRVHYEPNSHPCKICALKFKHRNSLVRHMCQHTGEQFRCGRCEAVYVSLEELNQHIKREHPHSDEAQENQIMAAAMSESEDSDDPPTPMEQHRTKSPPVVMEISVPKAPLPKIPISRMPNTRRSSPKVTMSRKATQMRTTNALNGFQTSIVAQNPQISAMSNSGGGQYALAFPGTTATPILVDCNGFVLQNLTWDGQNQFQAAPSHQQTHHQPQQQQPPVQYFQSINGAVSQGGLQFASQPQSYFSFGNQIYSTSVPFPQDSLSNGPQGILEIPHEGFTIPVQDNQIKFEIIDTPTLEPTMTRPVLKENPVDIAMKEIMDIHVVSIEDNEIQEIAKEPPPSVHTLSTHDDIVDDDNDDDDDDDEVMILEMPSSHTARQEPITRSIKSEPITFPEKDDEDEEVMSSKTSGSEHPASQMNSFQENARKEPIKEKSGLEPPKLTIEGNSVQHQLESFSSKLKELRNGFGASSPYPSSSSSSPSSFAAPSYSFSSGRRVEEEKGHGSAQSKTSLATRENKDLVDPSPPKKQEYKCEKCSRIYKYLEFLKVHQKRCSA